MSAFSDLIKVDKNGRIYYNKWIEWIHLYNYVGIEREVVEEYIAVALRHCASCMALSGCYFFKGVMPKYPLHPHCDCKIMDIDINWVKKKAKAECKIEKFTEYIFTDEEQSKGKKALFESWGFDISDSEYLKNEFCRQALENYLSGNYKLKKLDGEGQRLAIPITLKNKTFNSGWLLKPEGLIINTTPYGGKFK